MSGLLEGRDFRRSVKERAHARQHHGQLHGGGNEEGGGGGFEVLRFRHLGPVFLVGGSGLTFALMVFIVTELGEGKWGRQAQDEYQQTSDGNRRTSYAVQPGYHVHNRNYYSGLAGIEM